METLTIISQAFNKIFDGVYKIGEQTRVRKGWDINNVRLTDADIKKRIYTQAEIDRETAEINQDNRMFDAQY